MVLKLFEPLLSKPKTINFWVLSEGSGFHRCFCISSKKQSHRCETTRGAETTQVWNRPLGWNDVAPYCGYWSHRWNGIWCLFLNAEVVIVFSLMVWCNMTLFCQNATVSAPRSLSNKFSLVSQAWDTLLYLSTIKRCQANDSLCCPAGSNSESDD